MENRFLRSWGRLPSSSDSDPELWGRGLLSTPVKQGDTGPSLVRLLKVARARQALGTVSGTWQVLTKL